MNKRKLSLLCLALCFALIIGGMSVAEAKTGFLRSAVSFVQNLISLSASDTVYETDFNKIDSHITKARGNADITFADGALLLSREAGTRLNLPDEVRISPNEDGSASSKDKLGIEFKVKRSDAKKVDIDFCDEDGVSLAKVKFQSKAGISFRYRDSLDGDLVEKILVNGSFINEYVDVKVQLNHITKTLDVWVDDENVVAGKYFANDGGNLAYMSVSLTARNYQTVSLDYCRIFEVEPTDEELAAMDCEMLEWESFAKEPIDSVSANLKLPQTGFYGSSLAWSSVPENAISPKGVISRSTEGDLDVQLIVTATKGEAPAKTRTYYVTLKKYVDPGFPQEGSEGCMVSASLTDGKFPKTLYKVIGNPPLKNEGLMLSEGDEILWLHDGKQTAYSEPLAYEMTLDGEDTVVGFYDSQDNLGYSLKTENNALYTLIRADYDSEAKWVKVKDGLTASKITVAIEPVSNSFSVWYGDDKVVSERIGNMDIIDIYKTTYSQKKGNAYLHGYKAYKPVLSDEVKIGFDANYLTERTLTWQDKDKLVEDLVPRKTGLAGSSITWRSENTNLIGDDGKIKRPEDSSYISDKVGMVATIKSGSKYIEKTLYFRVAGGVNDELPEVGEHIFSETFDKNQVYTKQDENGHDVVSWTMRKEDTLIKPLNETMVYHRISNFNVDGGDALSRAQINFTAPNEPLEGTFAIEFTLRKYDKQPTRVRIGGTGGEYFAINWYEDGHMLVYYRNEPTMDSEVKTVAIDGFKESTAKFVVLFNTYEDQFSLWLNGKNYVHNKYGYTAFVGGIRYLNITCMNEDYLKMELDNIHIYRSSLLSDERVRLDKDRLALPSLVQQDDNAAEFGYVSKNLSLPDKGYYGSDITWKSLTPNLVSDDGLLNPGSDFADAVMEATISAGVEPHKVTDKKTIEFVVAPAVSEDSEAVARDAAMISYSGISVLENGSQDIIRSLSFTGTGAFGSKITWETSDPLHITQSGRVIRPRYDEPDAKVKITATITKGSSSVKKEFEFNVLADEPFVDPQHMTDEEFFGVYENGEWTTEGKFDYEYEGLEGVRDAAMAGDYVRAKEELLDYVQNKRASKTVVTRSIRDRKWANAVIDDWSFQGTGRTYAQADMYIGDTWQENSTDIRVNQIAPGATVCWDIMAWYNEASYAEIYRANAENEKFRPRLELVVNDGEIMTFYPTEDLIIRAGEYKKTNFSDMEYIRVQDYGDTESDNLWQGVLKFKFDGLKETDVVRSGRIYLYARALPEGCGGKRLFISKQVQTTWNSAVSNYSSFMRNIYSFNGQPGGNPWEFIPEADIEYFFQASRFAGWQTVAAEYLVTGDEEYAYKSQRIYENMMTHRLDFTCADTDYIYTAPEDGGLRGGFPRSMDAGFRAEFIAGAMDILMKSKYVTPDYCAATLKSLWDTAHYLTVYNSIGLNWRQHEFESLMELTRCLPEFKDAYKSENNWYQYCVSDLARQLYDDEAKLSAAFPDGSPLEMSTGYSNASYLGFVEFKKKVMAAGATLPEAYDDRLLKWAYYQALINDSDGIGVGYGDATPGGKVSASNYTDVIRWYNATDLEYIVTQGERGTKPDFTSYSWPCGAVTTLRAGWEKGSPFLLTNVRGGAQHDHSDYNGIWLNAYGRVLLSDAGVFSYSTDDPYRIWGMSTRAHNTVIINDTNQYRAVGDKRQTQGTIHEFYSNDAFDYLSQSLPEVNTPGFTHRRSITFIKPNIFFVTDLMTPSDKTKLNNYKQLWHLQPDSNITVDPETRTIYSNYATKGNIIVASADADVNTVEEMGWYDRASNMIEENPFGYFEKAFVGGDTTFDTVLMPNNQDRSAKLSATKLESEKNATAMRIDFTEHNADYIGYYHMDYNEDGNNGGVFGPYETDAQIAYVQENDKGEVVAVTIKNGTYIRKTDGGKNILSSPEDVDAHVDMITSYTYITGDEEAVSEIVFAVPDNYNEKLFVNDVETNYNVADGFVADIGKEGAGAQNPGTDNETGNNVSGVQGTPSGGGSGGGGGAGGGSGDSGDKPSEKPDKPIVGTDTKSFHDIDKHWAKAYIEDLQIKQIVNGDENGNFNPDKSIKRSEFVAIAVRAAALEISEYKNGFKDVSDKAWYADIIQTALDNGIISADDNFRPDALITREEMAKIICGIAKLDELYKNDIILSDKYTDAKDVSSWAEKYVKYISASALMQGRSDGSFAPRAGATRAEAATVISRMLEMLEALKEK